MNDGPANRNESMEQILCSNKEFLWDPSHRVHDVVTTLNQRHWRHLSHWAHNVVTTLNQRQWRWFNVVTTSCAQWASGNNQGRFQWRQMNQRQGQRKWWLTNAGTPLCQRRRRWHSGVPALGECLQDVATHGRWQWHCAGPRPSPDRCPALSCRARRR